MIFRKICVIGLGYIGLPTASTFATHGIQVIGVDINQKVLNTLRNGGLHIHEPGLRTLVQAALRSGKLTICDKPEPADAFIIAVPTPFYDDKKADLSYVISAAEAVSYVLQPGNLVVLESTSPPRTTVDLIASVLERSGLQAGSSRPGSGFLLAYSPERVLPGKILQELIENARVIGGIDSESAEAGRDLYSTFVRGEILLTDATTAEMVKLMENTYRDVNIAIANEFSNLAERFGVDVWEAISIANLHPRVKILSPGPGVGGHCIAVDPWFLVEAAPDLTPLIRTARQVNDSRPKAVVDLVCYSLQVEKVENLRDKHIAVLGLSYKSDVDDLRESPAVEVAHLLAAAGASVRAYEPFKKDAQLPGLITVPSLEQAVENADVLVLLVSHTSLKEIDPAEIARLTPARVVVDTVNGWPTEQWEAVGFRVIRQGNGKNFLNIPVREKETT